MKVCSITGCQDRRVGKGYCMMHWQRNRNGVPMDKPRPNIHGLTKTKEYRIWKNMKCRCSNKNIPCYPDYGGRGIKVCDRWENSFTDFLSDMGNIPEGKSSIDRIDNSGNYEPSNCRWASWSEQAYNRRKRSTPPHNKVLTDENRIDISKNYKQKGAEYFSKKYGVAVGTVKNVYWRRDKQNNI